MTITSRDKIEQFKRDLKSLGYYESVINNLHLELEAVEVRLNGVASSTVKDVIIENRNPYDQSHKLGMIMESDEIQKNIDMYRRLINEIKSRTTCIDPLIMRICLKLYVERRNHDTVADEFGFTKRAMYRVINRELDKKL